MTILFNPRKVSYSFTALKQAAESGDFPAQLFYDSVRLALTNAAMAVDLNSYPLGYISWADQVTFGDDRDYVVRVQLDPATSWLFYPAIDGNVIYWFSFGAGNTVRRLASHVMTEEDRPLFNLPYFSNRQYRSTNVQYMQHVHHEQERLYQSMGVPAAVLQAPVEPQPALLPQTQLARHQRGIVIHSGENDDVATG